MRRASARYQRSRRGKRMHARRQQRYLKRRKKVTHQGSREYGGEADFARLQERVPRVTEAVRCQGHKFQRGEVPRCRFCGRCGDGVTRAALQSRGLSP